MFFIFKIMLFFAVKPAKSGFIFDIQPHLGKEDGQSVFVGLRG